jgi:hypothetical protein
LVLSGKLFDLLIFNSLFCTKMFLKLSPICDTLNKTLRKNLKRMSDFYSKDETKVLKTLMTFFSL